VRRESVLTGSLPDTPRSIDWAIAAPAERQRGLMTAVQLQAIGLDTSAVSNRAARGVLRRVYRGVYAVGRPASREAQMLAAVFAGGDGALLGHLAVAELLGLRRKRASLIDVIVLRDRKAPPGLRFHRTRSIHPRDRTTHNRIPVTSVPRLLVDLTDVLTPLELANASTRPNRSRTRSEDELRDRVLEENGYSVLRFGERQLAAAVERISGW